MGGICEERQGSAVVVDDDGEMRRLLGMILRRAGYAVDLAGSAEEALAAARSSVPDVVVTDLHMPGMDGIELVGALQAFAPDVPVLVLTAHGDVRSAVRAMRAGAEDYLTKPVDPQALRFAIERAIERRRQRAENDELRRALTELAKAHVALQEERDFVHAVLETADALVVALDREGRILRWNRACERATGYAGDEVMGKRFVEALVAPEDRARVEAHLESLLHGQSQRIEHEHPLQVKEGSPRLVVWRSAALADEAGQVRHVIKAGLDVTEARELSARMRRTEHLASLATFSAGVAHEIKNPLNAAALHLQLIQRMAARPATLDLAEVQDAASIAGGEIRRVSGILEEFLQFARPKPLRRSTLDLRQIAEDVAALCRPEAGTREISIEVEGEPELLVSADEARMRQVLLNLVRNATEAIGQGGRVRLSLRRIEGTAQVAVEDDGPGLGASEMKIFEPFFTTKEKGTGLGLSITHRIVTDHGGDIVVQSRPGQTVFTVSLPVKTQG